MLAEYASIQSLNKARVHPSAIWLRQVFPLQTNNRRGRRRLTLEKGDE